MEIATQAAIGILDGEMRIKRISRVAVPCGYVILVGRRRRTGRLETDWPRGYMTHEMALGIMVDRIVRKFRPLRVILFGSHARGAATSQSDIDLLVVFPELSDRRGTTIEIRRALSDLPVSKDIVVTTPDEIARRGHLVGSLLHPALREGKTLYER